LLITLSASTDVAELRPRLADRHTVCVWIPHQRKRPPERWPQTAEKARSPARRGYVFSFNILFAYAIPQQPAMHIGMAAGVAVPSTDEDSSLVRADNAVDRLNPPIADPTSSL